MTQHYALLSIVYMISFVLVFERVHFKSHFCDKGLLGEQDIDQLRRIWSACQES